MNKKFLFISFTILGILLIISIVMAYITFSTINNDGTEQSSKPNVVELFACGDYCPGPREQYVVKVYDGVKTKEDCDKYAGVFESFTGWGTTYYCKAI